MERIFLVLGLTFLLLGAVAPQHEGWELILFLGLGLTLWGAYRRGLRGLIMVVVLTLYLYVYWFAHGAMDGIVLLKSFSRHLTDDERPRLDLSLDVLQLRQATFVPLLGDRSHGGHVLSLRYPCCVRGGALARPRAPARSRRDGCFGVSEQP